jgi:hypothetical protein
VIAACRVAGAPATAAYAAAAGERLTALVKDGVTVGEALAVARYAAKRYEAGDKFPPLLNLNYLWAPRKFPALAAAMGKDEQAERRAAAQRRVA